MLSNGSNLSAALTGRGDALSVVLVLVGVTQFCPTSLRRVEIRRETNHIDAMNSKNDAAVPIEAL